MQILVDAMAAVGHGNVDKSPPFGIINFNAAPPPRVIKAEIGSTEKIETPAPNRAGVGKAILFNVLGQAERDAEDGLASLFVVLPGSFGLIEDQHGFVVRQGGNFDFVGGRVPAFSKPIP